MHPCIVGHIQSLYIINHSPTSLPLRLRYVNSLCSDWLPWVGPCFEKQSRLKCTEQIRLLPDSHEQHNVYGLFIPRLIFTQEKKKKKLRVENEHTH